MQPSTDTVLFGRRSSLALIVRQPLLALAFVCACVPLALLTPLVMPIGPMYWDHYIYLDAANRIFDGQRPSIDFFAPVGGLGYYLFAGWLYLFPNGHPLLLSSWSLMTVTVPLMALIVRDIQKRSVGIAYALLLPFLLFSLLPFNTGEFYPYPGSDGFGIYNRQICQLLYVLAGGLVFVRGWKTLAAVAALSMLAILFIKITGMVAGVILCLLAFMSGRLQWRAVLAAGVGFCAALAGLEMAFGIVSAYAADIFALLHINDTSLLPRLLQAVSLNFGIFVACVLLGLALVVNDWRTFLDAKRGFFAKPSFTAFGNAIDQSFIWLAGFFVAGLLFESQNTGSQAFIFLWPLLLAIMLENYRRKGPSLQFAAIAVLALCVAVPPAIFLVQKSARAWIGSINNTQIESRNLKSMGYVGVREVMSRRAAHLRRTYIEHKAVYEAMAVADDLPSFLLYSDFDFQALVLQNANEAVSAIHALETDKNVRFDTIMNIDFINPFAWLMDRHAPKYIAIGADPYRAVPEPDKRVRDAVGAVDIALYPTCPPTPARMMLLKLYEPILARSHNRITLTPCFDAFVRNGLGPKF